MKTVENRANGAIGDFIEGMVGNKRAISKSKIKNNIAMRKNRKENGSRAEFIGSNPHS